MTDDGQEGEGIGEPMKEHNPKKRNDELEE